MYSVVEPTNTVVLTQLIELCTSYPRGYFNFFTERSQVFEAAHALSKENCPRIYKRRGIGTDAFSDEYSPRYT